MASITTCALYNEYGEELRWQFTEPLGTCIYNIFDEFSFIIGWMSVASWTFALLPQIVTNCKNKAAESQSFWFWMLWLVGDVANFMGCILTKNLVTNTALALVYFSLTLFACLQFIWYEYIVKKLKFEQQKKAFLQHQLLMHATSTQHVFAADAKHNIVDGHGHGQATKLRVGSAPMRPIAVDTKLKPKPQPTIYDTPTFVARYHTALYATNNHMSPGLRCALALVARSARMYSVSPQLTGKQKREYLALRARRREQEEHLQFTFSNGDDDNNGNMCELSETQERKEAVDAAESAHQSKSLIKIYTDANAQTAAAATDNDDDDAMVRKDDHEDSAEPLKSTAATHSQYGSTIISTLSSMTMTVVMLHALSGDDSHESQSQSRRLLGSGGDTLNGMEGALLLGMILGWISSVIYISSRIPQLRLMMHTKNVSGINPAFFCLTFSGNLTQCLSMVINKQIYVQRADFVSKLPWLISSGVCIFQDGYILFLIYLYGGNGNAREQKKCCLKTDSKRKRKKVMSTPALLLNQ